MRLRWRRRCVLSRRVVFRSAVRLSAALPVARSLKARCDRAKKNFVCKALLNSREVADGEQCERESSRCVGYCACTARLRTCWCSLSAFVLRSERKYPSPKPLPELRYVRWGVRSNSERCVPAPGPQEPTFAPPCKRKPRRWLLQQLCADFFPTAGKEESTGITHHCCSV